MNRLRFLKFRRRPRPPRPPFSRLCRIAGGLALAATVVGPFRALFVEPRRGPVVTRYAVTPTGWPSGRRLRIVALADIHAAWPHVPRDRVRRIVDRANGLGGDVVVLLGDNVGDHLGAGFRAVGHRATAAELGRLSAPGGVWAVLGDHDWKQDEAPSARGALPVEAGEAMAAAGIRVLHNGAGLAEAPGGPVWLGGLGCQRTPNPHGGIGLDDVAAVAAAVPDDGRPAILLMHQPDAFPDVPPRFGLTLCGHTHGGQVRLGSWIPYVPSRFGTRYARGHYREDRRHLIVSSGIGCSGLPIRHGVPPEIVVVDVGGAQ